MRDERISVVPTARHAMPPARLALVVRELSDRCQARTCLPACGGAA
jgi:hypothetical protein